MSNLKIKNINGNILSIIFICIFLIQVYGVAQNNVLIHQININNDLSVNLIHPSLVKKLYQYTGNKLIWFLPGENSAHLRNLLKTKIDSSINIGLQKDKYHIDELDQNTNKIFSREDSLAAMLADRTFTDAAIAYSKDVFQGADIDHWIRYDELSLKCEDADNTYLLNNLAAVKSGNDLLQFLNSLEPEDKEYLVLKNELQAKSDSLSSFQQRQLTTSLNFYRWMHHFNFEKYIVVNIASATLRYYEYDSMKLGMKVVAGKPSTKTPRFAAHCSQVILYPYWNVPASITRDELLPKFKRHPQEIDELGMQVIDGKGNLIDHHKLNWKKFSKSYFPYRIRQSTGCDNSLGVIKFNLTSPLGVYLHDTNNKAAFMSGLRYYSHGCIRIEEPIKLANYLLPGKVDSKFLESCIKGQVPVPIDLVKPVPVFVIYQTVETDIKNEVKYYKDVYGLLK
jgi:murein L,D-transpeptidase YcbB/YkuD